MQPTSNLTGHIPIAAPLFNRQNLGPHRLTARPYVRKIGPRLPQGEAVVCARPRIEVIQFEAVIFPKAHRTDFPVPSRAHGEVVTAIALVLKVH